MRIWIILSRVYISFALCFGRGERNVRANSTGFSQAGESPPYSKYDKEPQIVRSGISGSFIWSIMYSLACSHCAFGGPQ